MSALRTAGAVAEASLPTRWCSGYRRAGLLALVYLVLSVVGVLSPIWGLGLIFWWEARRLRDRVTARRLSALLGKNNS